MNTDVFFDARNYDSSQNIINTFEYHGYKIFLYNVYQASTRILWYWASIRTDECYHETVPMKTKSSVFRSIRQFFTREQESDLGLFLHMQANPISFR